MNNRFPIFFFLLAFTLFGCNSYNIPQSKDYYTPSVDQSTKSVKQSKDEVYPFYVGTAGDNTFIYSSASYLYTTQKLQRGQQFIYQDTTGSFIKIIFGNQTGYVAKIAMLKHTGYSAAAIKTLIFKTEYGTYDYIPSGTNTDDNYSSSSTSTTSSTDKSVHVNGYTKKDGTYVAPYYRSAPHKH